MRAERSPTADDANGSIEVKDAGQDVEMKDSIESDHSDTEAEITEHGEKDMFYTIQKLTMLLSSFEEE